MLYLCQKKNPNNNYAAVCGMTKLFYGPGGKTGNIFVKFGFFIYLNGVMLC
jgi:hypothetical protein